MRKERQRLLEILFAYGYTTEESVLKIGIPEILELDTRLTYPQMEQLNHLQAAVREKKLLSWIAGTYPEAPSAAQSSEVDDNGSF